MTAHYGIDFGMDIQMTTALDAAADTAIAPRAETRRAGFLAGGLEWMPLERSAGLDPLDLWITLHDRSERGVGEGWRFARRHEVEELISAFCEEPEGRAELLGMLGATHTEVALDGTVRRMLDAYFTEDPMREIGLGLVRGEVLTRNGRLVDSLFESRDPWMSEIGAKTAAVLVVRDEHWTALAGDEANGRDAARAEAREQLGLLIWGLLI